MVNKALEIKPRVNYCAMTPVRWPPTASMINVLCE